MSKSKIEWTDEVWNPITGCTKVSDGCQNCYAEREWPRLSANSKTSYYGRKFNDVFYDHRKLSQPLRWKKARKIFVNSMSDLFHENVTNEQLDEIFGVMLACHILNNIPDHIFMVLTKRPERMRNYFSERTPVELLKAWAEASNWITLDNPDVLFEELVYSATCHDWDKAGRNSSGSEYKPWVYIDKLWPLPNLWLGVTAENQKAADERIPLLLQVPATIRLISAEPLLGPVNLTVLCKDKSYAVDALKGIARSNDPISLNPEPPIPLNKLDWLIVGGESGPNARPMHPEWVCSLRDQCVAAKVPFFFKQWGEYHQVGECMNGSDDSKFYNMPNVRRVNLKGGQGYHGEKSIYMQKVGKKNAGRLLDGRTWDETPSNMED